MRRAILSNEDCDRLRRLAAFFQIYVRGSSEQGLDVCNPATMTRVVHVADFVAGHYRVLAEICSMTAEFIRYSIDDDRSCAEVLFAYSDQQLMRIAERTLERRSGLCLPEAGKHKH